MTLLGRLLGLQAHAAADDLTIGLVFGYNLIDLAPVGKSTHHCVVDEDVGLYLAAKVSVLGHVLFGIVLVDRPELNASLTTPLNGIVEQFAFANGPEDQLVTVLDELPQSLCGKRDLATNFRVAVFYDCTIKIYSNLHYDTSSINV